MTFILLSVASARYPEPREEAGEVKRFIKRLLGRNTTNQTIESWRQYLVD